MPGRSSACTAMTNSLPGFRSISRRLDMGSAKYYIEILGRSFYGCKHACGIARMRQAYFAQAGFEMQPAG